MQSLFTSWIVVAGLYQVEVNLSTRWLEYFAVELYLIYNCHCLTYNSIHTMFLISLVVLQMGGMVQQAPGAPNMYHHMAANQLYQNQAVAAAAIVTMANGVNVMPANMIAVTQQSQIHNQGHNNSQHLLHQEVCKHYRYLVTSYSTQIRL